MEEAAARYKRTQYTRPRHTNIVTYTQVHSFINGHSRERALMERLLSGQRELMQQMIDDQKHNVDKLTQEKLAKLAAKERRDSQKRILKVFSSLSPEAKETHFHSVSEHVSTTRQQCSPRPKMLGVQVDHTSGEKMQLTHQVSSYIDIACSLRVHMFITPIVLLRIVLETIIYSHYVTLHYTCFFVLCAGHSVVEGTITCETGEKVQVVRS